MAVCYMLGGRAFSSAAQQTTIAQSGYVMGVLRKHGLDHVINKQGDLLGAILDAGCAPALVAGLVTEDRKPWTRDDALQNAAFFEGLTDEASHAEFWDALSQLLTNFFPPGGSSNRASPTSSTRPRRRPARKFQSPPSPATPPETSTASSSASSPPSVSTPGGA